MNEMGSPRQPVRGYIRIVGSRDIKCCCLTEPEARSLLQCNARLPNRDGHLSVEIPLAREIDGLAPGISVANDKAPMLADGLG
jgi:hypothetical protein